MNRPLNASRRRRQKKGRTDSRTTSPRKRRQEPTVDDLDDIDEQLRRQRLKQQQQSPAAVEDKPRPPPQQMGRFRYDAERDAYFPAQHVRERETKAAAAAALVEAPQWKAKRAVTFAYSAALQPTSVARKRLAASWGARSVLESTRLTLSGVKTDGQWSFLFPNLFYSGECISDIACKDRLPLWSRTLAVFSSNSTRNTTFNNAAPISIQAGELPHVVTLTNDSAIRLASDGAFYRSRARWIHIRALPRLRKSELNCCAGMLIHSEDSSGSQFWNFGSDFMNPKRTRLAAKANDFVDTSCHTVLFATDRIRNATGDAFSPWRVDYRDETLAHPVHVNGFPQSEALCIATTSGNDETAVSPLAYFGHRNGQLTIFDARSPTCQSTTLNKQDSSLFGSVVQLLPLQIQPHHMLARGTNDSCRLYEMRKLGGGGQSTMLHQVDPAIVNSFTPPIGTKDSETVSRCSGLATNSTESVLIAPYTATIASTLTTDPTMTTAAEARLGMWSLHTGVFVGWKGFQQGSAESRLSGGPSWVELCSTITPAWAYPSNTTGNNSSNNNRLKKVPGSFGLWMKCDGGDWTEIPDSAGHIHHAYFDGRLD